MKRLMILSLFVMLFLQGCGSASSSSSTRDLSSAEQQAMGRLVGKSFNSQRSSN